MNIAVFIFALTATLANAAPAVADWAFTKWGMTPEQVVAASPSNFQISSYASATGALTWRAGGHYTPPIGGPLHWEMLLYGPFDGNRWRNCRLTIDGQIATQVGTRVPCG